MSRTTVLNVLSLIIFILASSGKAADTPATQPAIDWNYYGDDVFARAHRDHKLIILDLQAVWCHWCHVQDEQTYSNAQVKQLIGDHFIAIKVDQDSRPDISNRYEDYGWPATIIFDSDGREIVKRRGFIPPDAMISLLKACIADPTPGPSIEPVHVIHPATQPALSGQEKAKLNKDLLDFYDAKNGGWGRGFKFIDADLIEYCTLQAKAGDKHAEQMVRQTLTAGLKLVDPAWGGVYQYSTDGDWDHPHFEKIMSFQADDMRTFAQAYVDWHDPAYLKAAQSIHHFLTTFLLSPEGAFCTSMDADRIPGVHGGEYFALNNADRRKLGIPRIDTHIYSRENGWVIASLVKFYQATGDEHALAQATTAADWIIDHRAIVGGGFTHGENDPAGPYLADTLAMGRAFLDLYGVTKNRGWLDKAIAAANFIERNFVVADEAKSPGVLTAVSQPADRLPMQAEVDENIAVVRFAAQLFTITRDMHDEQLANRAMRYLAAPEVAGKRGWLVGGLLLADREHTAHCG
jgi:uncharacterized protein YyaL (SSP411 family)